MPSQGSPAPAHVSNLPAELTKAPSFTGAGAQGAHSSLRSPGSGLDSGPPNLQNAMILLVCLCALGQKGTGRPWTRKSVDEPKPLPR